ncbi:Kunitz-like protease inhibitor [Echinococcus granulosus]|uniref:Kunitz-like protease inhibitor n=1 Tax=Echinococcus granulosus TaxID=6210 RepID=W6UTH4_ECHGR|nr:Kunitz-like protease inhibitor [Echinococcus granulosus]EUB61667.1 Kunitz-like protease inhibitor [Echinococcus granulosus]
MLSKKSKLSNGQKEAIENRNIPLNLNNKTKQQLDSGTPICQNSPIKAQPSVEGVCSHRSLESKGEKKVKGRTTVLLSGPIYTMETAFTLYGTSTFIPLFKFPWLNYASLGNVIFSIFCTKTVPSKPEYCLLEMDHGPCFALLLRYAYDKKLDQCVEFTFGGCGGNKNNFETLEECEKNCKSIFLQKQKTGLKFYRHTKLRRQPGHQIANMMSLHVGTHESGFDQGPRYYLQQDLTPSSLSIA